MRLRVRVPSPRIWATASFVRREIDPPDRFLIRLTIVEDRQRYAAEERECCDMAIAERLGHFRRIGLHEAGVRVWQVHAEIVDPLALACDDGVRLPKIDLGMTGLVAQGNEHLTRAQLLRADIIAQHRQAASVTVFIPQALEQALAGMALLARRSPVLGNDTVDDRRERTQLL